jgi:hypothetical protein
VRLTAETKRNIKQAWKAKELADDFEPKRYYRQLIDENYAPETAADLVAREARRRTLLARHKVKNAEDPATRKNSQPQYARGGSDHEPARTFRFHARFCFHSASTGGGDPVAHCGASFG